MFFKRKRKVIFQKRVRYENNKIVIENYYVQYKEGDLIILNG